MMSTARQIRQQFLDFFRSKGHAIVPSAPIVIKNDPTLLFTNAGMNQFKDYFLGNRAATDKRVADTQKCLRVSGKHNDLEEVGVDTYHHTMFEMLGNWSFGDYFKKEAIEWSWELLTEVYGIPKDRLYVTVFQGDEADNLPMDQEAYDLWLQRVAPERILMGNKKDNFWEMGDTGPCGPCTEIHVDCRSDDERNASDGAALVNADHPQVIEIWNNVFMQFNRLKDRSLEFLPDQHVDTGMGLERLVRVLQGKQSNYDTDLFTGTIKAVEQITGLAYDFSDSKQAIAFRVIADHIRAISFTIADGQLPASTGAGYVIRRILRRAVRYYFSYLNYKQPLLHALLPSLIEQFHGVFPELEQQSEFIGRVIREEEEAFLRTLDKGLRRLDEAFSQSAGKRLAGNVAFELYDTYGFPLDLTELIAQERAFGVDQEGFAAEMQQQKTRSRAATALDTGDWAVLQEDNGVTFTGYDSLEEAARTLRYRKVKAKGKEFYQIVLDRTPFYAESGGQAGDTGELQFGDDTIQVIDTKKENDLIVHLTETLPGSLEGTVIARVDAVKRQSTEKNHSGTHLLQAALRRVLGAHVVQKGSLNNDHYLRFDFAHFSKVTKEELLEISRIVNEKIRENIPVVIKTMDRDEAMNSGAMALFGEKYGDRVRVVTMDPGYSVELCGGTHVRYTGELGLFRITSEGAVAAGVRRIEAVTGPVAEASVYQLEDQAEAIRGLLKNAKDPVKSLEALLTEQAAMRRQLEQHEQRWISGLRQELAQQAKVLHGVKLISAEVPEGSSDALKKLAAQLAQETGTAVSLTSSAEGKANAVIAFSSDLVAAGRDAGKLVKERVSQLIGGGGGGQKSLAAAGGINTLGLADVGKMVEEYLAH